MRKTTATMKLQIEHQILCQKRHKNALKVKGG